MGLALARNLIMILIGSTLLRPSAVTELDLSLLSVSPAQLDATRRWREIHPYQSHSSSSLSKCRPDHRGALVKHRPTPPTFSR
jgi:hypothetical protein